MCCGGQRAALDGRSLLHTIVPEYDLTGVGAAKNEVRMELGEAGGHNGALTVEDVFRCGFLEFGVPDHDDAVRFVGAFLVIVVGGEQ